MLLETVTDNCLNGEHLGTTAKNKCLNNLTLLVIQAVKKELGTTVARKLI